jgi:hypothetical protein
VVRGNYSAFLPGSHVALIADWATSTVRLVDVDSRTDVSHFEALGGQSLWYVSPDGRVATSGGATGVTRLYDLQTGTQIGNPFPSTTAYTLGLVSPDGRSMLVPGAASILWDIDPASWREKACTAAGRNLTKLEWQQHMPSDEPYRATCPEFPIET